jgi:hypothetical protein
VLITVMIQQLQQVSRLSEILSSNWTVRLTRDCATDTDMIRRLLMEGELIICPRA